MKNRYAAFVLFLVLFTAFWTLLGFLYSIAILKTEYQFSISDLLFSGGIGALVGYLIFLRNGEEN